MIHKNNDTEGKKLFEQHDPDKTQDFKKVKCCRCGCEYPKYLYKKTARYASGIRIEVTWHKDCWFCRNPSKTVFKSTNKLKDIRTALGGLPAGNTTPEPSNPPSISVSDVPSEPQYK